MEHDTFFNTAADTILKGLIDNNSSVERCLNFAEFVIEETTGRPYYNWKEVVRDLKEKEYIAFPEGVDDSIYGIGYVTNIGKAFVKMSSYCDPGHPIITNIQ